MKRKSSKKIKNKLVTRRRSMHGGSWICGFVEKSKEYLDLLAEKNRFEAENASIKAEKAIIETDNTKLRFRLNTPSDLACPPPPRLQTQPTIVTFDFKLLKIINDFPFLKIDKSFKSVESVEDVKSVEAVKSVEGGEFKTYDHKSSSLRNSTQAEQNIYKSFIQGTFTKTVTVVDSNCKIVGFVECLEPTELPTELLYLDINSDSTTNYVVLTESTEKSLPNLSKYYVLSDGITINIRGFSSLRNKS